ncbi:MAG: hypothetical protein ACXWMZ_18975 [Vulcanimicrobiaceae bacterium]
MERHTLTATVSVIGLVSVVVPIILLSWAMAGRGAVNGPFLSAAIYAISVYIFWAWLRVDVPRNSLPSSAAVVALGAYIVLFVVAVAGYLFYSRGAIRGFGAVMWFALLLVASIVGFFAVGGMINVISPALPFRP